jgi:hypothetical protein
MMRKIPIRALALMILTAILLLTLTSCGSVKYSRLGISFEIPRRFEPRALAGATFAYGDDEAFIVFTRRTQSELLAGGLSELNVAEFTDRFLSDNGMKDAVEVDYSTDRAEFGYVVADPDNEAVYYYYYTVVFKGKDCIWIAQMACYEALADKYIPEFDKWAGSIEIE